MTPPIPTPEAVIAVIRRLADEGQINRGVGRLPLASGTTLDQLALKSLDLLILADSLATHFDIDLDERIAFEQMLTLDGLARRIAENAKAGQSADYRRVDLPHCRFDRDPITPNDPAFAPLLTAFDALVNRLMAWHDEDATGIPTELADQVVDEFHRVSRLMSTGLFDTKTPEPTRQVLGASIKRCLLPIIAWTGTANRFYSKPLGYAGDFYTIELIYQNIPQGEGWLGALVDRCFLEAPASRAVRNRRSLLAEEILRSIPGLSPGQPRRAMSLGCGPLREVFDAFHRLDDRASLEVVAVDIDPRALKFARQRAQTEGVADRVRLIPADLLAVANGGQAIDLAPQDLIYSIGLIDYFDDPSVIRLLDWIHDHLAPGGRVLLGNFHPHNPDRALMDYVLEWPLIHRTEADMRRLFQASRFASPGSRILFEAEGINLFAEGVRFDQSSRC